MDRSAERREAEDAIARLSIRTPDASQRVLNLSGGNQQKVVLAKWLAAQAEMLIFDEPTRGIDVGSKSEIYKLMRGLADSGIAVLMSASLISISP